MLVRTFALAIHIIVWCVSSPETSMMLRPIPCCHRHRRAWTFIESKENKIVCDESFGAYNLELHDSPSDEETLSLAREIKRFNFAMA